MFHKLHSKERINRRAQSQGPPPSPHFSHHRNNVEAWFCGEGGEVQLVWEVLCRRQFWATGGRSILSHFSAVDQSRGHDQGFLCNPRFPWKLASSFLWNQCVPSIFMFYVGYQFSLCNRLRTYQNPAKSAVHYRNGVFHLTSNRNPEDAQIK